MNKISPKGPKKQDDEAASGDGGLDMGDEFYDEYQDWEDGGTGFKSSSKLGPHNKARELGFEKQSKRKQHQKDAKVRYWRKHRDDF